MKFPSRGGGSAVSWTEPVMDHAHAKDIVTRAEKVRPNLDGSAAMRLVGLAGVLIYTAGIMGLASLQPWLRSRGFSPESVEWYPSVVILFAVAIPMMVLTRRNRRRLHDARETMLCPHCRAVLREDGPAHWQACDDTVRVCQSCNETICDEVYAAAALPTLRDELTRKAGRGPGLIVASAALLALYFGFAAVNQPATAWLERRGHEHADLVMLMLLAAVCVAVPSLALLILFSAKRSVNLAATRWLDAPFCPGCDERFPDGALETTILHCAACDTRMATAVGIVDSLTARAVVGPPTPVPWPRGEQAPAPSAKISGDSRAT